MQVTTVSSWQKIAVLVDDVPVGLIFTGVGTGQS